MIYFRKLFFPTTISIIFSIGYYLGLYINSEIDYLRTLLYKTTERMQLMNDKYDLLLNEFSHLKNNLTNVETTTFVDCECQTMVEETPVIQHIIEEHDHDHDYEILDKFLTTPDIKVKIRGNSVTDILTKFF
jgi:hypothetical protein